MKFSKDIRRQLRSALKSSFRSYKALEIFVSDSFEFRLNDIASSNALDSATYDLSEYCDAKGSLGELILALHREQAGNLEVKRLVGQLQGWVEQRMAIDRPLAQGVEDFPFVVPTAIKQLELESFLPRPLSFETDVGLLLRGLRRASAVCKVSFVNGSQTGTGVAIARNLVLTNYHVVSRQDLGDHSALEALAQAARLEFGFVRGEDNLPPISKTFAVDGTQAVLISSPPAKLDYVLLQAEQAMAQTSEIVPIAFESPSIPPPNSGLNLLQHPAGERMQVSLSVSGVLGSDEQQGRIWYANRTKGGSSGSPCFNDNWEIVALHHASEGVKWFGSLKCVDNVGEGILCRSIFEEIKYFL